MRYKREYLPSLRRLIKEYEDAIIDRDTEKEDEKYIELLDILGDIRDADYLIEEQIEDKK